MNVMRASTLALVLGLFGASARADSIVSSGTLVVQGNGFGSAQPDLTVQTNGTSIESGCIAPGLLSGSTACASGDGATGGDEAPPIDFPKQGAPTLSSLGITSGDQIGILFDAVQPQSADNATVNINDLTLKLYSGSTLLYSVSGSFSSLATNPGNGASDYLFTLDPAAVLSFDAAVNGNFGDAIALDSTISFPNQSSGADSFSIVNLSSPVAAPEPGSLFLLGTALAGAAGAVRGRFHRS